MLPSTIITNIYIYIYICLAFFVLNFLNGFAELLIQHRAGWHTGPKNKARKHRRETRRGRRAHATLHNYKIYVPSIFCFLIFSMVLVNY